MMTPPLSLPSFILSLVLGMPLLIGSAVEARSAEPTSPNANNPQARFFEQEIRPLLAAKCQKCHGGEKTQGGLKLTTREEIDSTIVIWSGEFG